MCGDNATSVFYALHLGFSVLPRQRLSFISFIIVSEGRTC
jgi:hypothetical protein